MAARYAGRERPAVLDPGDVVLFGGHVLHRSHANRTARRSRRAFVAHFCNARSLVPWDDEPLGPGTRPTTATREAVARTPLPTARELLAALAAAALWRYAGEARSRTQGPARVCRRTGEPTSR